MNDESSIAVVAEIKAALPAKVSESYVRKAIAQGLTVQKAREASDLSNNFPVSIYHVIKLKRDTDLKNDDLLNILQAWEETPQLSIRSLRSLYEVCDRDAEIFEHVVSEFVLPYAIGEANSGWSMGTSRTMARLTDKLQHHLEKGGSILDFVFKI